MNARLLVLSVLCAACGFDPPRLVPEVPVCTGISAGELQIAEILANPAGDDAGKEYIELVNTGDKGLDLAGLTITYKDTSHAVAAGQVAAGEAFVLAGVLDELRPDYADHGYGNAFELKNDGERLLLACGDIVVDDVTYPKAESGVALYRDPSGGFCAAKQAFAEGFIGTPGVVNEPCGEIGEGSCRDGNRRRLALAPRPGDLVITEIMADSKAVSDTDGEWIEVLARAEVDLNGVALSRPQGDATQASTFASDDCLRVTSGQRVLLGRDSDAAKNGGLPALFSTFSISLLNSNSSLTLSVGGELLDSVAYEKLTPGSARSLKPEAETPEGNDVIENWIDCVAVYGLGDKGTPGTDNAACASGELP